MTFELVAIRDQQGNIHHSSDGGVYYFLIVSKTPVSFAKVFENVYDVPVELCEIETRDIYRNYGYAKILLSMLAEKYHVDKIPHYGEFTQCGFDYVSKYLDRSGGDEAIAHYPHYTNKNPLTFVKDWDNMIPKYY